MKQAFRATTALAVLGAAAATVAILVGCASTPAVPGASHVYVPQYLPMNSDGQAYVNGFPVTASGTAAPSISVTLPLNFNPLAIAIDPAGKTYIGGQYGDYGQVQILAYAAGATGNIAPEATYTPASSGSYTFPVWMAINSQGEFFIVSGDGSLETFASAADLGGAPKQRITTLIDNNTFTTGIAGDDAGNIYVTDLYNAAIDVFAPDAQGDTEPIRTITGVGSDSFYYLDAITADGAGNVYVANYNPADDPFASVARPWRGAVGRLGGKALQTNTVRPMVAPSAASGIYEFAAGSSGQAQPVRTITGTATQIAEPSFLAADRAGNLYYTDFNGGTPKVIVFPAKSNGNVAPTASFTSADVLLVGDLPIELAVY